MRRFRIGLICGFGGYLLGALVGYVLIARFSSNTHDRSVEAAMTALFAVGPFAAVVGVILGVVFGGKKAGGTDAGASLGA